MKQAISIQTWRDVGQALSLYAGFADDERFEPTGEAVIETVPKDSKCLFTLSIYVSEKIGTKVLSTSANPKAKMGRKGR